MQSKDYWILRALQREDNAFRSTADTLRRLRSIYDLSAERLVRMVKNILGNFMKASGIQDEQEAKRLLTIQETAETLAALRAEYASTGNQKALAKLNAPAYAYRISRAQAIRKAIDAEAEWLNEKELQVGAKRLVETYDDAYHKTMYDTAKDADQEITYSPLPVRDVTEALENRWKGENYSERVWDNTHLVASEAGKIIDAGLTSGATVAQMSRDIMDLFDVAYYAAARLVRTEINRMHNDATIKSYKAMGIKEYTYLATLDARTCSVCGALDMKHFKVSEARTGVNLPPMHPNDRCTTVAYYRGDEVTGTRIARDPTTGKNYKVDRNLTYEQWRKEIAEKYGAESLKTAQKRYINLKKDAAEQRTMQKILGDKVPPKIADFQDLKYNKPETYRFIKLDYQRQMRLKADPTLALPNAKKATAADAKFTGYLFNPENPKGYAKGKAFVSRLGYDETNWKDLQGEILRYAPKYPARFTLESQYGKRYEQKMILYGSNGTPANVIVGWCEKDGATWMTTCYIKEVE